MDENKENKEGMTVREMENMAKKYRFELIFCLSFFLAGVFAYLFNMEAWSIFLAAIGGIIGICLPKHMDKCAHKCFQFINKQEKVTKIIVSVVMIVISIFICPIIFLLLGLMGGVEIYHSVSEHHEHHDNG